MPPPNAWQQFTAAKPVEAGILSGTALTAVSVLAATVASRAYVARVNAREGGLQRNKAAFMLAKTFGVPPQTYLGSVEGFASQLQEARGREESLCKEVRQLQEYAQAMQERYDSAQNHRRSLEDSLGQLEQDLNALRQLEERERLGWQAEEAGMRRQMRSLEERAESLGVMKERSEAELQMLQDQVSARANGFMMLHDGFSFAFVEGEPRKKTKEKENETVFNDSPTIPPPRCRVSTVCRSRT